MQLNKVHAVTTMDRAAADNLADRGPHKLERLPVTARGRRSAIDGRTTRHAGYAVSQRTRKRIEEAFGWVKTVAGQDKSRFPTTDPH